jgi:hypothetical protein
MENIIEDVAYLEEWFRENENCFIIPYIETHFAEASYNYQYWFMKKHLFFAKKIIQDSMLTNDEKIHKLLDSLSFGKSKIITIIGGRGQGKTCLVMFLIEEIYKKKVHTNIYYIKKGERPEWLPQWIKSAQTMEDVPNKSVAVLDETAIEYSSRNFYKDENKSFTDRLVILRHKDISVFLITQHSKLVDINIRRLSDIMIYKPGADITTEKSDDEIFLIMQRLMPKKKEQSLIEFRNGKKYYVIETGLPEFWDNELVSKTFKNFSPEELRRKQRQHKLEQELEMHRKKERIRAEEYSKKGIMATSSKMP